MRRWLTTTLLATIVAVVLWLLKYETLPKAYDHDRFRTQPTDRLHHFDAFVTERV